MIDFRIVKSIGKKLELPTLNLCIKNNIILEEKNKKQGIEKS